MILLSAHGDTLYRPRMMSFLGGVYRGQLDNWLGQLVVHATIFSNPVLIDLAKWGQLGVMHLWGEEYGFVAVPMIPEPSAVIVVDVAAGDEYKDVDFAVENIYRWKTRDLQKTLEANGFKVRVVPWDPKHEGDDEALMWHDFGIPCLSFIIPVGSPTGAWHRVAQDLTCTAQVVDKAIDGLACLLQYAFDEFPMPDMPDALKERVWKGWAKR